MKNKTKKIIIYSSAIRCINYLIANHIITVHTIISFFNDLNIHPVSTSNNELHE